MARDVLRPGIKTFVVFREKGELCSAHEPQLSLVGRKKSPSLMRIVP